jgi:hypothetical protein
MTKDIGLVGSFQVVFSDQYFNGFHEPNILNSSSIFMFDFMNDTYELTESHF